MKKIVFLFACTALIIPVYAQETPPVTTEGPKTTEVVQPAESKEVPVVPVEPAPVKAPEPVKAAVPIKPVVPPLPAGFDAALKSFNAKKYPEATKAFQGFIKNGSSDERIHDYLAQCYYRQRQYTNAIKEYEWVAKNGKNSISLQHSAAKTARTLQYYMKGVCPENCVKADDPRWQPAPNLPGRWLKFNTPDGPHYLSSVHIGQLLTFNRGHPHAGERCPVCRGTGKVRPLKDGDPL